MRFFYEMLKRCIPELYERADRTKIPTPLEKELRSITRKVKPKVRIADLLVSVPLLDGKDTWILLHCELQGKGGGNLAQRMFMYKTLIFARHAELVVGLAIITDKRSADEPTFYECSFFGCKETYIYNRTVVMDMNPEELKASDNPFDLALYAGQCAIQSKRSERQRFIFFKELLTLLSLHNWSRSDKDDFLVFLDGILTINDKDAIAELSLFEEEIMEEEKPMALQDMKTPLRTYIYEKGVEKGIEKGIEKGKLEGLLAAARNLLKTGMEPSHVAQVTELPLKTIQSIL